MPSIVNTSQVDLAEPTGAAGSVNVIDTSGGVKLAAPVVLVNQAGEAVDFLTDTELRATPLSVTVSNPTSNITGYATEATLQVIAAKPNAPSVVGLDAPTLAALETITSNTGGLTDTQLRASALPISGTVTANTGLVQPLTDTQLRATSLNVTVSNQLDGYASEATLGLVKTVLDSIDAKTTSTVSVTNFPATQPVTLSSIPLATNAANADLQADAKLLLEEIEAKLPALINGALPVTDANILALQEVTQSVKDLSDTMLYFITAMLDKMPRLDSNDRMMAYIDNGALNTLNTLTTVTTVSAVTNLQNFAGGNTALIPYQMGAGAAHIYQNIIVS